MRSLDDLRRTVRTVIGITVTPFTEEGRLDEAAYERLVARTIKGGISVLTPNGNTSEFYSLRREERLRSVEITVRAANGAVVVGGVGLDAAGAVSDALHYRNIGAECVMIHQPVLPFWSLEGWVEYHRQIAESVPDTGIIPYIKDPRIDLETMRSVLAACPNIIGVKYAVTDPAQFAAFVLALGDEQVSWICGVAEVWAPFFAVGGASGFTSGLVSVDPGRSLRMLEHLRGRDYSAAMTEWAAVSGFESLRSRRSSEFNVSVVKEALAQMGLCRRDVRAPLSLLPQANRDAVRETLVGWEMLPTPSNAS